MANVRPLFIDGKWVHTGKDVPVASPWDGREVARVAFGAAEHMEAAMQAAVRAFEETRRLSRRQRADILQAIAASISRRKEEIALTMTDEMGKPLQYSRAEVDRAV